MSREEGMCGSERDKGTDETPILVTPRGGIRGPQGTGKPWFGSAVCVGNELGAWPGVRDRERESGDPRCPRG